MKKSILFLVFSLLFVVFSASAQYDITPGEGFPALKIGMKIDAFIEMLGEPSSVTSFKDERDGWESSGYDTKKQLVFYLGFDNVYEFDNSTNFCIWKVFVKDGKVVCINASSYGNAGSGAKKVTVSKQVHFFDSYEVVKSSLGTATLIVTDESDNHEYFYFSEGLSFVINDEQVRNIFIYEKADKKKVKKMKTDLKI